MLADPRNRVGSGPMFSSLRSPTCGRATYRDTLARWKWHGMPRLGLAKAGEDATISGNSPAFNRANARGNPARIRGSSHHDKANPAQRLRHELRGASVAGAVDPSARPHRSTTTACPTGSISRRRWSAAGSTGCSSPTCSASTTSIGNSPDAALRNAAQTPANEPLMLIPAMAAVTRTSRLRRHQQSLLRAALPVRAADVDARSSHRRPGRLERRDRLSRQRRARRRQGQADRA